MWAIPCLTILKKSPFRFPGQIRIKTFRQLPFCPVPECRRSITSGSPCSRWLKTIQSRYPHARFIVNTPNDIIEHALQENLDPYLDIAFRRSGIEATTRHADLTLVASGTATLQVAAQCCPMIVMYYVDPLQWYLLARWLIKTDHIALVNILAQEEIVPEFIPFYRDIEKVSQTALELLKDEKKRFATHKALQKLIKPLNKPGTAKSVARIIKQMMPRY